MSGVFLGVAAAFAAASASAATPPAAAMEGPWLLHGKPAAMTPLGGGSPPLLPSAADAYRKRVDARKAGKPLPDTVSECIAHGVPRLMYAPYPIQILFEPKQVTILHEVNHQVRWVHLDEAAAPEDADEGYLGYSVGRWEGDTLVVETTKQVDKTLLDDAGLPHSRDLKVTERLRVIGGGKTLEDVIRIDDPKTYSKPWTARITFDKRPGLRFRQNVCASGPRRAEAQPTTFHSCSRIGSRLAA